MRVLLAVALGATLVLGGCGSPDGGARSDAGWAAATALTGTEDHAAGIATDGTVAVFSTGGSQVGENAVRSVPLDGSAPSRVLVADPLDGIPSRELVVLGDTVYVAVGTGVAAVPLVGGPATAVVTDRPGSLTSLAADGRYLFWTTSELDQPERAEVGRVPLAGGAAVVLAGPEPGRGSYSSVVPDGTGGAYVASPGGLLHAVPGADPVVVVSEAEATGAVTRIARDDERLYGVVAGGRNDLFAVALAGGPPVRLAPRADATGALAAVDGGVAFFVGDDLRWVPGTGGEPVTIASGRYADGTVAAADDRLVFPADWRIWTAPVPG